MKNVKLIVLSISIALASGCNLFDDDDDDTVVDANTVLESEVKYGTFVDSAVEGLEYKTSSQSGFTDEEGTFSYLEGEDITFSLGGTVLPTVKAGEIITPKTLYSTEDATDPRVQNVNRLLQSLDDNNNPDDGITITSTLRNQLGSMVLDPNSETFSDDAETVLQDLGKDLVSKEDALHHFVKGKAYAQADLIGSWFDVAAILPSSETLSPIDAFNHNEFIWEVKDNTGQVFEEGEFEEGENDSLSLNIDSNGQLLEKEGNDNSYDYVDAYLSNNKDKIAFIYPENADDSYSDSAYEFGLAIKLANTYEQRDLEGLWYNVGMDIPENGALAKDSLPVVFMEKKEIDIQGNVNSFNGDSVGMVTLSGDGRVSFKDIDLLIAYLSQSKDTILYSETSEIGEWYFGIMLKQGGQKLSDLQGNWKAHFAGLSQAGDYAPENFEYETASLAISADGTIIHGDEIRKATLHSDGLFTIASSSEVTPVVPESAPEKWVINEGKDIIVGIYTEESGEQGFLIAIKQVEN